MVAVGRKCRTPAPPGFHYVPPDGGFGWWVVIGSCLAAAIVYVPLSSFGLLFLDILQDLDTTASTLSWVPSICLSASMLFTPVVNMLIANYSCRTAALCGGILASTGMILSYFATNVGVLFFTFGIIYGPGLGCIYCTTILVLSEYFRDHFGLVTGLATAFYSVGKLIFAPIVQLMLETMTYHSVFLVLGALCLNICVGAALFQPGQWHYVLKPIPAPLPGTVNFASGPNNLKQNGVRCALDTSEDKRSSAIESESSTRKDNVTEVGFSTGNGTETEFSIGNGSSSHMERNEFPRLRSSSCNASGRDPEIQRLLHRGSTASGHQVNLASSWDIFGSVQSVFVRNESANMVKEVMVEETVEDDTGCYSWWRTGPFKLDMKLLTEPVFHVILWSGLFSSIVAVYQAVYLPSLMVETGLLPMEAATIVSFKAGGEITGRIITPYVQERFKISLLPLFLSLYLIQVGLLILCTLLTTFHGLAVVTVLSGFAYGGYAGLAMLVFVDSVGHSRLSSIFALTKFLQGIMGVGVGPLIGYVKDVVGAFKVCFYILAGIQLVCSFVWALQPLAKRKSFRDQ